jgi:lipopolysaccharide biosynthesis regulator YciM
LVEGAGRSPDFETLRVDYTDTIYGQYARFYLADRKNIRRPEAQPEGWDNVTYGNYPFTESIARYTSLLEDAPDFPLADECMLNLAKAYRSVNKTAEAAAVLAELIEDFPESPVIQEATALAAKLQPVE